MAEKGKSISESFLNKDVPLEPLDINIIELEPEIDLISDPNIRKFVRYLLKNAPAFWKAPGSQDAGIHPPDEEFEGGLVKHTKRVVRIALLMAVGIDLEGQYEHDCLIAAAILHDISKYLMDQEEELIIFDPMHPYTVDRFVHWARQESMNLGSESDNAVDIDTQYIELILRLIRCSHGVWSPIPETIPTSELEKVLHQADFIASNLHLIIDGEKVKEDRWI